MIAIIVAMAKNRVIGKNGQLPWQLPTDLQRFKKLTMGHTLLMGRATFESLGQPLLGRRIIVVSRNPDYRATGCDVVASIEAGLVLGNSASKLFICGGEDIYRQTLPLVERIYLTKLDIEVVGDTYFPPILVSDFVQIQSDHCHDKINYEFSIWHRSKADKQ